MSSQAVPAVSRSLSLPNILLRIESVTVVFGALFLYGQSGGSWWLPVMLFLVPDLSALGYVRGRRLGSITYNIAHMYVWSVLLLLIYWFTRESAWLQLGLIWALHIGVDRTVGYGFKYETAFKDTHMQRV